MRDFLTKKRIKKHSVTIQDENAIVLSIDEHSVFYFKFTRRLFQLYYEISEIMHTHRPRETVTDKYNHSVHYLKLQRLLSCFL